MITNDVAKLEEDAQMLAAFPNAQGRLLAIVRVMRHEEKFLFETEEATRQAVYDNLFRFTMAGDFFVENLSENYRFFSIFDRSFVPSTRGLLEFESCAGTDYFVPHDDAEDFLTELNNVDGIAASDDAFETFRIESGIPLFGVDMDETTIVPELGLDGLISYNKGCYIGQEIIARIHFRGHVAKQLTGLVITTETPRRGDFESVPAAVADGLTRQTSTSNLATTDGKNAGRITS
ncbi:MAG: hypothetical protein LC734_10975, partial [Acidobacteria bacterium]|nr:hypothetical protein [Acidobacteriota bacterium]